MKHTPGPWPIDWYVCREGKKELWRVPRSIGPVSVAHNHWAGNHLDADAADAHLIAAAPDMLEALCGFVEWAELMGTDDRNSRLVAARAAIACATSKD